MTKDIESRQAAAPGINIDLIVLRTCAFEDRLFESVVASKSEPKQPGGSGDSEVDLRAQIRVYFNPQKTSALLELQIDAEPRVQPTWKASISVAGQFTAQENAVLPIEQFVWSNGIAYLVPFIRERLASLTSASVFETFYLPPISVPAILAMAGVSLGSGRPQAAADTVAGKPRKTAKKATAR